MRRLRRIESASKIANQILELKFAIYKHKGQSLSPSDLCMLSIITI